MWVYQGPENDYTFITKNIKQMERAILTKRVLRNFFIIDKPGTSVIPCASTVKSEYAVINLNTIYYKVYLRAITKRNFKAVLKLLDEDPILPFIEVSDHFLHGVIYNAQLTDGYALPTKGENVIVTIVNDFKYGLQPSNIDLIPRNTYHRISNEDILPLIQTFKNYYNGNKSDNRPDLS